MICVDDSSGLPGTLPDRQAGLSPLVQNQQRARQGARRNNQPVTLLFVSRNAIRDAVTV
jgi:hypothetical protein